MVDGGERQTLVVIGNGMTSHALCRRLAECGVTRSELEVVVFGEEPRPAYDRVHLTDLFAGKTDGELTLAPAGWYEEQGIKLVLGDPIATIDRDECLVRSARGVTVLFDRLVFATGSRPFVPPIPGTELPGVFVYRTVDDLRGIAAYARRAARAAVIGGGLLGLEAARAVHALGLEVHVIEASAGLMHRQLDAAASRLLGEIVEGLGVRVHTGRRTARIDEKDGGDVPARLLSFADGSRLEVDMVILAAGIRPRGELAEAAGLAMAPNGGVIVDDRLQTSDSRVFAVGECAVHRGVHYGLAAPGLRMVDVLVNNLAGGSAIFAGASRSARLKLLGVHVASLGRPDETETPGATAHVFRTGNVYRKLVVADGGIVGAIAVGEWDDLVRIEDALAEPRRFSFWDLRRFRGTGTLFLRSESPPVHEWPAEALVCGCLGVRRGVLGDAERAGCCTVDALSARTGAGTMCGSCRPLLADFLRRGRVESMPPSAGAPLSARSTEILAMRPPPSFARIDRYDAEAAGPSSRDGEETPPTLRCNADEDAPVDDSMSPLSIPELGPASRDLGVLEPRAAPPAAAPVHHASETRAEAAYIALADGPLSVRRPEQLITLGRATSLPRRRSGFDTLQSVPPPADGATALARDTSPIRVEAAARSLAAAIPVPVEAAPISVAPASVIASRREGPPAAPVTHDDIDAAPVSSRDTGRYAALVRASSIPGLRAPLIPDLLPSSRSSAPPPSGPDSAPISIDSMPPPSTRRETMPPLRPISVPPGRLPSIPPPRLSLAAPTPAQIVEERRRRQLLASAAIAAAGALIAIAAPAIGPARSYRGLSADALVVDPIVRQISGYAALVLSLSALVLSARKRVKHFGWSNIPGLRALHGVLGAAALACLFVHTGLHLGVRLNRVLMLDFLAITLLGAAAGVFAAAAGNADPVAAQARRLLVFRAHIVLFLPFPVLVALHVLGAYYF